MAQLNSMCIEPSHGHNGSATRTTRCATVIIIYDENVAAPRDCTANGQDGDLCAEPRRRAAATAEYDDMVLAVGGSDITEYLVVAHGIAFLEREVRITDTDLGERVRQVPPGASATSCCRASRASGRCDAICGRRTRRERRQLQARSPGRPQSHRPCARRGRDWCVV